MSHKPPPSFIIEHLPNHVHIHFQKPRWVLSSAVLNGGLTQSRHIVNLRVEKNPRGEKTDFEPSEQTLSRYCLQMGWKGVVVGMMTAATFDSFRKVTRKEAGVEVTALVTVGLSNAKRAGTPAECREITQGPPASGTINIIILTNALLTPSALAESIITVTEAKSVALQDSGITDPLTGAPATGTGTDAVAIVNGFGPVEIAFCGKHVLFGEMLASTVIEAITSSLNDHNTIAV